MPNIFDQSQTLPNIIQQYPTSPNNAQHGWPNDPNIYTQYCWHLLGKNVGIVWPGLKATYYGKTSRHFIVRCREHIGVNKNGKSIKGAPSSIRDHIVSMGHSASINDFCIINTASNELDLRIHESLLILRDRPTLNQQNSSIPLCLF